MQILVDLCEITDKAVCYREYLTAALHDNNRKNVGNAFCYVKASYHQMNSHGNRICGQNYDDEYYNIQQFVSIIYNANC